MLLYHELMILLLQHPEHWKYRCGSFDNIHPLYIKCITTKYLKESRVEARSAVGTWDEWVEKVGSHAGSGDMEPRMEPSHKWGRAGFPLWTRQASKGAREAFIAPMLGAPNFTWHMWERKHKSGLRGQKTWAPESALATNR